jgi:hypothetical protein
LPVEAERQTAGKPVLWRVRELPRAGQLALAYVVLAVVLYVLFIASHLG